MAFSRRNTAVRIATVSVAIAALASPIAWYIEREHAEDHLMSFASEESRRVIAYHGNEQSTNAPQKSAAAAAAALVGGIFDIAEIYDEAGSKLAEAHTELGERVEPSLPKHSRPDYRKPFYESLQVAGGLWAVRVFVPLRTAAGAPNGSFEGVRVVPAWQYQQILHDALIGALMVCLASLLCGAALYPIVVRLLEENAHKTQEVLESHIAMMEALGRAIAKRDSDTGAHNFRVAWIAARLGELLGFSGSRMLSLIAGSFLHDAGKIGIPDAILLKPDRLDAQETAIMRTHVPLGEEIVSGAGWLDGARDVVSSHHEKWDGSGYPAGLSGEAIPLAARIFAIADVFDALTSRRPYKEPFSFDESIRILQEGSGSHFEPALMDRFLGIAGDLYAKTAGLHENEMMRLMEATVRQHVFAAE